MLDLFYFLLIITLFSSFASYSAIKLEEERKNFNPVFANNISNLLHFLSYIPPFKWFVDVEGKSQKTMQTKQDLADAHLNHILNYRSFMVLKVLQLMFSVFLFFVLSFALTHTHTVLYFLFKTEVAQITGAELSDMKYMMLMFLGVLFFVPNMFVKKRINDFSYRTLRDVPLLQMFVVLMLKSNKTTAEIIFGLSQINTFYREMFHVAYLRYLRSSDECFDFLEDVFADSDFLPTLNTLKTQSLYPKDKTISLIENQMADTISVTNNKKRNKDITNLVFAQATVIFPFVSFILLCLAPLAMYGISILGSSGNVLFG